MQNNPSVQTSSFINSLGPTTSDQSRTSSSPSSKTRTNRNRLGRGSDHGQIHRRNETDSDSINVAGLTFAQRLYASALVANKEGNVASDSTDADSDRSHTQIPRASAARTERTTPNQHTTSSPPLLSMEALSLNAYSDSREDNTSLSTRGSIYKGVAGHTHSPSTLNGDHTSHALSHRTRSLPIPPQQSSTHVNKHRASTVSTATPPSISAFMKPYTFTPPPSETPNRVLVARPPVKHAHSQQSDIGTSAQTNAVPPLPLKPSPIQYSTTQFNSSPSSFASNQIPNSVPPTSAPRPQPLSTTYTQPQNANSLPPQTPLTPPLTPPTQVAKPSTNSKNPLASALGRTALRFVGSAVLGSIFGAVPLDSLFSGIAGSVLDAGTLDTLTSSLANFSLSDAGLDPSQFQAAFTGVPGTDYQSIINSILQQQQTAPSPRVDYQAIVDALKKIQQTQMMAASNGVGGSGPGGTPASYQALGNAQNQHVHGLMAAIQQQAAQNAQMLQQQIQQIQNSAQVDATHQVQGFLQAAYEQQIAMNASAGTSQPQQTFQPLQQQQTMLTQSLHPQQQQSAVQQNQPYQQQQTTLTQSLPQQQQTAVQQNQPYQQQHTYSHSHQNQHQHQPPRPQLNHYHSTPHLQSSVHAPHQTSSSTNQHQQYPTSFQPPRPTTFQNQPPQPTSLQQPPGPPLQQQQPLPPPQQQQQQPQQQPPQQVQPNNYQQPQTPPFSNHQQYEPPQSNVGQDPMYTQDPQSYPTTQYDAANYNNSEQMSGYPLTPGGSTADEVAPPSFSSILGHAFDIGNQLLNGSGSSSAGGGDGDAAPGYTLTDQGGGGGGGGGETGGFNTFFDGVMSYAGSMSVDVGGNSFDFSASISGGEDAYPN